MTITPMTMPMTTPTTRRPAEGPTMTGPYGIIDLSTLKNPEGA